MAEDANRIQERPGDAHFVRASADTLGEVPVWIFSSGPLDDSSHTATIEALRSVAKLMACRRAGRRRLRGRLTEDAEGFLAGRMARTRSGDWRGFDDVRAWAAKIAAELGSA